MPQQDAGSERWHDRYLGLPEAAALAASEAKKAASPVSLPGPDLQSLGSPTMQTVYSASLATAEMSIDNDMSSYSCGGKTSQTWLLLLTLNHGILSKQNRFHCCQKHLKWVCM